jgi:hypothetical protein
MSYGIHTDRWWDIGVPLQSSNKKSGNTWKHWTSPKAKNSKCVIRYSVMQEGSTMLNSRVGAWQAMWTLALIHWHLCQAIWDLNICHEVWPFSMTVQPHTARVKHGSGYSHFSGKLWTIHPIVLDFALLDCHLSGPLKQDLGHCWFHSNEEMEMAVSGCICLIFLQQNLLLLCQDGQIHQHDWGIS